MSFLANARRAQERTMLQVARIGRKSIFDDPAGGTSSTISVLGPYPCRVGVGRLQRGEEMVAGRLQGRIPFVVTLPALTDIRPEDVINVDGDGTLTGGRFANGRTFEVIGRYA